MKQLLVTLFCIVLLVTACTGQNIKQDSKGNFYSDTAKTAKTGETYTNTGKTYTDTKGVVYVVYASKNSKLFILRTSKKTGKQYKQYLKI